MSRTRSLLATLLVAVVVTLPSTLPTAAQPPAKARKVAFLVGVSDFKHDPKPLGGSPKKDVTKLAEELEKGGFDVVMLTDAEATKEAIEEKFKAVLDGGGKAALGNKDLLLVALCSHGFTVDVRLPDGTKSSEPYLAAHNTRLGHTNTMVSLNGLIAEAKSFAPTTLFLVDACRERDDPNRGTRGIEGKQVTLPKRTAVLFACGEGQLSHQSDKADGHGLFTYAVLKTMREGGGGNWDRMVSGVKEAFETDEMKAMLPAGAIQTPILATGELGYTPLLAKSEPGEVRKFEVAAGLFMEFCWIPPGKATLGSPETEAWREKNEPEKEYESKGFWLGKYEVTQEEWVKVTELANPSYFVPTQETVRQAGIKDTSRFPVEGSFGRDGFKMFLKKLNDRPGGASAFGKPGKFVLPHEDEWEYACRGNKGNKRAFYFGNTPDGTEVNCIGGQDLKRTCAVDDTNGGKYPKHPWGLCHMHGNVYEMCENEKEDKSMNARGGSCGNAFGGCRSANRYAHSLPNVRSYQGFRVCYRLN